ncbi:hypothetical protein OROHE_016402 [Orobanche hederae]
MRIHNFRVIFNEYNAILSPTYVGHIIIKVCVVGFGRTNDQFSRNTVTSGFSLAMRIHDFGLSEENDAIILRTYVGHTIVKVCVVGFGRKNDQFSRNYDAVLLCSYVAHVIIKVLANENPLFRPNSDNYYDVLPPSYVMCVNNSDEYGASLTHSYITQVITTVCLVRCGRNKNQFLRNTVLAMRIHDFGLSEENDAIILCTYVGHIIIKVCVYVVLAMRIHNFRVIFNEYDAILSPTYVGHIIIKVCVVGFGRTNDQFSRNTVTSGFSLATRIHDFGLSEENDAIILRTYVGHTIVKVCVVGFGRKNDQFSRNVELLRCRSSMLLHCTRHNKRCNNSDEYGASLTHSYIAQVITTVCVVRCGRNNNQFLRNTGTPGFRLAMKIYDFGPILNITMPFFHVYV